MLDLQRIQTDPIANMQVNIAFLMSLFSRLTPSFETFCEHSEGTKQGTGQDIYVKAVFCTLKVICRNFLSEIHSHLVWLAILYDIIIVNHVYCMIDMDTSSSCHPFSVPHLVYSFCG